MAVSIWLRGAAGLRSSMRTFSTSRSFPSIGGTPFYSATLGGSFMVLSSFHQSTDSSLYIQPVSKTGEIGAAKSVKATRGNIVPFQDGYALIWDDETNLHSGL